MSKTIIPLPKGLEIPDGKKDGDTLELMCEFTIESGGTKLCLTEVDGNVMAGYKDTDKDTDEFSKTYAENAPKYGMEG